MTSLTSLNVSHGIKCVTSPFIELSRPLTLQKREEVTPTSTLDDILRFKGMHFIDILSRRRETMTGDE